MIYKKSERGQILVIVAITIIALFGFAALAIDGSRAFSNKRNAQNAADTAVLAAALKMARGASEVDAKQAAMDRADSNNFDNQAHPSGYTNTVSVNFCNETGITCEGLPAGAVTSEYIRVRIESTIPTTFARVIGRQTLMAAGEAIAHVGGGAAYSFLPGNAMVSLNKTGCGICGGGNSTIKVLGSGIFSNSTDSNCGSNQGSIEFQGLSGGSNPGGAVYVEGGYNMATGGSMCYDKDKALPNGVLPPPVAHLPQVQSFSVTVPEPSFSCSAGHAAPEKVGTVTVYHPGTYDANETISRIVGTTEIKFEGNYCFNGFVKYTGTEKLIMTNANIRAGGAFQINAAGPVTCSNVMVFSDGGTGVQFAGSGSVNCQGITFYMKTGNVKWNGGSSLTLNAPTSGTYKGLLLYMPESNHSSVEINGNNSTGLVGTIMTPGSTVALAGNSGAAGYDTQIIANIIDMTGNNNTFINYHPSNQYIPPPNPTIQLTK